MATVIPSNRAAFTIAEVARATGGDAFGEAEARFVCTDSREAADGALFVALRGERFDAHRFLPEVAAGGASIAVVARGSVVPDGLAHVVVDDTLVALGRLAAFHRARWGKKVVAITGSAGKTTTKELCRAALEEAGYVVHATAGNLNNRIGAPMTLLGLEAHHDVAVVEMGTSEAGEIARLAEIGCPDVAVVLMVAEAHTEGLSTLEAVADEKTALFRALGPDGVAIANADDPRVMARRPTGRRTLTFGVAADADIRLAHWAVTERGTSARYVVAGDTLELDLPLLGEAAVVDAAAALAVGEALGAPRAAIVRGLERARPAPQRLCLGAGQRGSLVLDDTYNANPRSMRVAIETAGALRVLRGRRLIAALGDMRELGALAADAHRAVGAQVAAAGASVFVAVGASMALAAAEAARLGVTVVRADDAAEAAALVASMLEDGDLVLAKGSRSMTMEAIVQALRPEEGAP